MTISLFDRLENTVRKGENAGEINNTILWSCRNYFGIICITFVKIEIILRDLESNVCEPTNRKELTKLQIESSF